MTARLLGFDPASGLAQWWLENGEGDWAQKSSQQVEALLDLNREARNHCDSYNTARDVRMVARIPLIVIAKWRNELGVDYWNPDHQQKVDALLDDADWRWLRTDTPSPRCGFGARVLWTNNDEVGPVPRGSGMSAETSAKAERAK
ncbi:MAG: hypothetical protein K2X72_19650 [Reyranella sp.]|nr:hypothetical protein [Reyranella sp.]